MFAVIGLMPLTSKAQSSGFEIIKNLELMDQVFEHLDLYFVDNPQPATLAKTGIDAMLKELDPYTVFYHESNIEDYRLMTTGEYGGIGALIRKIDDYVYITDPYEGKPAQKSGLKAGDKILSIDGRDMRKKSSKEVSKALKGPKGSTIKIVVERMNKGELELEVERDEIKLDDVPYHGMIDNQVGYVKLNSFTPTASKQVKEAITSLNNQGMKSLVFDLRGNGGGLLMEAVKIVNFFVPKNQVVVTTKGRIKEENKTFKTLAEPLYEDIPLSILIDENSASASEIVAGSLQDLDRAVIIGQTSFGKGLVQRTYDLNYGSKIKVTIAKYYTPSGRCVQRLEYYDKAEGMRPQEIADSLLQKFETRNGREVIDGRGIEPDISVNLKELSTLSLQLISNNFIFKFANEFQSNHSKIDSVGKYRFNEKDFEEFKEFVLKQPFEYRTRSNEELKILEKQIQEEGNYDSMEEILRLAKEKLAPNISKDLKKYKEEISDILQDEIVSRFYFQKGRKENSFGSDPFLKKAIEILKNEKEYNLILKN